METTDPDQTTGLKPVNSQSSSGEYLSEMWRRRQFALALPVEEMRVAHQTTLLGNVWHLVTPVLTVGVYYLVFGKLLKVDRGVDHFLVWLTVGVFSFRLSQSSVLKGATSVTSNSGLLRSMKFPRALLPMSAVFSELLSFAIELAVLAVMCVFAVGISRRWLFLPVVLLGHTALNLGVGFIVARLNDTFRDIQQIIPFVFRLLQYVSGVMFPITRLLSEEPGQHAVLAQLVAVNPLLEVIQLYRWVFLGTELDVGAAVRSGAIAALILWFGFRFFRAAELRYGRP